MTAMKMLYFESEHALSTAGYRERIYVSYSGIEILLLSQSVGERA